MNQTVVTLLSMKPCELKRFLCQYYRQNLDIEEGTFRWTCSYQKALDSSLLLATLIDNSEDFKIEAFISIRHSDSIPVSKQNINDIIKYLYFLEEF